MIGRAVFYAEPVGGAEIFGLLASMFIMTNSLLVVHVIITKVGMIYADAEILRTGNEELLNNLEEGVIILSGKS